mgnify:CR=1 FL=1
MYLCLVEKVKEIAADEVEDVLSHLLDFSKHFKHVSILHSNHYQDKYGQYEFIAAFGGYRLFEPKELAFEQLKSYHQESPSWLFGHLSYDLKNQIEKLESRHEGNFSFGDLAFFEPAYLVFQERSSQTIQCFCNFDVDAKPILDWVSRLKDAVVLPKQKLSAMKARLSKVDYLKAIEKLKEEIQYGNIYEVNYCQGFYQEQIQLQPEAFFHQINTHSPMPFASFYKQNQNVLMGASPERYLCKRGDKLYSQPIKGTYRRGKNPEEDKQLKTALRDDLKEQTENVMIVDLVRNDLSRTAAKSSVKVEELFGMYTFPQVHQLISTVSSTLKSDVHFTEAIRCSYPMGSMTGAPKISAMKLIDQYEKTKRELYSGSVGYIDPYGNFDFNVVIRSLLYDTQKQYLSLTVGGAITNQSDAEKEYEECLLKAKAIFEQQN